MHARRNHRSTERRIDFLSARSRYRGGTRPPNAHSCFCRRNHRAHPPSSRPRRVGPDRLGSPRTTSVGAVIGKMFDDLSDLYQQVILDHCKHPRNFHDLPEASCSAQGHNPLCGDQLKLYLKTEGDIIKDASFIGSGCCISKASASLLTEYVKGKTKADVQKMFEQVHEMVT